MSSIIRWLKSRPDEVEEKFRDDLAISFYQQYYTKLKINMSVVEGGAKPFLPGTHECASFDNKFLWDNPIDYTRLPYRMVRAYPGDNATRVIWEKQPRPSTNSQPPADQ